MRFIDEYRNVNSVKVLAEKIKSVCKRHWTIMEVCGGQTHNIMKFGLEQLLPRNVELIHGPGCPVCVIPTEYIDKAILISEYPDTILVSYGDMLRVPGSRSDLLSSTAEGNDIRVIYSPLDGALLAEQHPDKKIVFFAIGFETTAPANGMAILAARTKRLKNFFMLSAQVIIPPTIELLLSSDDFKINGVLAPGHVCTITGYDSYIAIAERHKVPIAITGFEPVDILAGILKVISLLEECKYEVSNQYSRSVRITGNTESKRIIEEVYELTDRKWRGIGIIAKSGLRLKQKYADFDAERVFEFKELSIVEPNLCIAGEILKGIKKPFECPVFLEECTPEHPLGAPMVSSEGICSAYFRYKNIQVH